jgi:predicted nucleic acid-binding protein
LIAFFDTNIYVDLLRGKITLDNLSSYSNYIIRLSPIVKSELIRGCKTQKAKRLTESYIHHLIEMPAPTNKIWEQAAVILSRFPETSQKYSEEIQNDVLLALSAKQNGAILVSQDKDFEIISKCVSFRWILFKS